MSPIKIILVDDHAVVRAGVRRMLEQQAKYEVIAELTTGEEAYQAYGNLQPDILVIDVSMQGMGGLESARRILIKDPLAKIVIFSMHENPAFASQAMKSGAKAYVAKTGGPDELLMAIQQVLRGGTYLSPIIAQKVAMQSLVGDESPIQQLSVREFEVFRLLAEGKNTEEISVVLSISQKTAANYYTLIKQKIGATSPLDLIRIAMRHGIVD